MTLHEEVSVQGEFDSFFRAHFAKVARSAALIACDAGPGQDAAQEAMLRLSQRWHRMESHEHALNFAFRAATNLSRSHVRKHRRLLPTGLHPDGIPSSSPDDGDWLDVVRALSKLTSRQRACVVLTDFARMDSMQVGRTLSIEPATVRVHVARGRAAVRKHLGLGDKEANYGA